MINNKIKYNDNSLKVYNNKDCYINNNNMDNSKNINIIKDINKKNIIDIDNNKIINKINDNEILINNNNNKFFSKKKEKKKKIFFDTIKLILLEFIENEDGIIDIKIKDEILGEFFTINCKKLILDSFLLCSNKNNNNLIKINENWKLIKYFKLNKSAYE